MSDWQTLSDQAIVTDGAVTERESGGAAGGSWRELMCELFQECLRGNVLIGTLRLDKDVRFKRSKAIIKYTTGRCCSKNIFAALPLCNPTSHPTPFFPSSFSPLYLVLSCQR